MSTPTRINKLKSAWQKVFNPIAPIPDELIPLTRLFGSRKWGGYTRKSDVDLAVTIENLSKVVQILENHPEITNVSLRSSGAYTHQFRGYSFKYKGFTYEISCFHNYKVWQILDIMDSYWADKTPSQKDREFSFTAFYYSITEESRYRYPDYHKFVQTYFPEYLL